MANHPILVALLLAAAPPTSPPPECPPAGQAVQRGVSPFEDEAPDDPPRGDTLPPADDGEDEQDEDRDRSSSPGDEEEEEMQA